MIRRVAALHFPSLPLDVVFASELARQGSPDQLPPCAVSHSVRGQVRLVAVSIAARHQGVRVGMGAVEAQANCASLVLRERDASLELLHLERMADRLLAFGSTVEVCPPSMLLVERTGRLDTEAHDLQEISAEMKQLGYRLSLVCADGVEVAVTLARHRSREPSRWTAVPPGEGGKALAELPVEAIAWTECRSDPEGKQKAQMNGVCEALRAVGLMTVGALRSLPAGEVGARFGVAGQVLVERSRGERSRPLRPHVPPKVFEEEYGFEQVTDALEPVLFGLRRLLHRLEGRLRAVHRAVRVLVLEFWVEPGEERILDIDAARPRSSKRWVKQEVRFARATRSAATLFAVAREHIQNQLPGGIWVMRLKAGVTEKVGGAQLDLFSQREQVCEDLGALLGRLSAALGDEAVFTPSIGNTHRPEASWQRKVFSVEDALRPAGKRVVPRHHPIPLPPRPTVLLRCPEPAKLIRDRMEVRWRGRRFAVRDIRAHEQLRTEWWLPDGQRLERDYFRVETVEGTHLWLYLTPRGETFLHGMFD